MSNKMQVLALTFALVAFLAVAMSGVALFKRGGWFSAATATQATQGAPTLVTVDVVKILNAQRALASRMVGKDDYAAATTLSQAGKSVHDTIKAVAGDNAIVLVKQAVVTAPRRIPDITAKVLDKLNLPDDVASLNPEDNLARATRYGNSPTYQKLEKGYNDRQARDKKWLENAVSEETDSLIP